MDFQCEIGERSTKFSAIVVQEIATKVNAEKLSDIKNEFFRKSIHLADSHLNETHNIEILLEADQTHVVPIHSCRFGSINNPSLIYYCNAGVLLAGDSLNLAKNMSDLSSVETFIEKLNAVF